MSEHEVRERYELDPGFHQMVNVLLGQQCSGNFTQTDLAQAVVLSAQLYAERYGPPVKIRIEVDHV